MNVGVDEAGKGCILGPVYAAAVIWDDSIEHRYLKDSKKLSKQQRSNMFDFVVENAIDYGIGFSTNEEIDSIGIHNANMNAMHKAIKALDLDFDHIHVDGNVFKSYENKPYTCIVGGDSKYKSISAASILAKVSHDTHIMSIFNNDSSLQKYSLETNMGYGTANHIEAVKTYGRTVYHRYSFKLPFEKGKSFFV